MKVAQSCLTLCDPTDCKPARLLCPWNSPGKDTGMDSCSLLQATSWILLPYPRRSPGDLPSPGIKPRSPALLAVWATREDSHIISLWSFLFVHLSVAIQVVSLSWPLWIVLLYTCVFSSQCIWLFGYIPRSGISGSYGSFIFSEKLPYGFP